MGGESGHRADHGDAIRVGDTTAARSRGLNRLASSQHGKVSRKQLTGIGFTSDAIDGNIRRGTFSVEHRGVYAVGPVARTKAGRAMAAVLACGDGAVVSHRSAAYLQGLLPYPARNDDVDVTTASKTAPERPGIRSHRVNSLDGRDTRIHDNIPVTSPARTLLDLAAKATESEFEQAFDEAVFRNKARKPQIEELIQRSAGRPGVVLLRDLWNAEASGRRNRLEAEKRFAGLVRAAKLPEPEPNVRIDRFVVDFLWPRHRVVVELDGFATHRDRRSFEGDRARDGDLQAMDFAVIRVTWRQLTKEPHAVVARVAARLALSGRELALG